MYFPAVPALLHEAGIFIFNPTTAILHGSGLARRCLIAVVIATVITVCPPLTAGVGVSIDGTVADIDGKPLSNAHIVIEETQSVSVSDWDGSYSIYDLPPGQYTITASHLGYETVEKSNVFVNDGFVTCIDFRLQPKSLDRSTVIIDRPMRGSRPFAGETVIVIRDIWENAGAGSTVDALNDISGVTVLEGDHNQRISLRGSSPRNVEVNLDGIPLNDAGTGEAEIGMIDLDRLRAIRVVFRGVGGRVDLLTDGTYSNANRSNELKAGYKSGSLGLQEGDVSLDRGYGAFDGYLAGNYNSETGDFEYRTDDGIVHRRINNDLASLGGMGKISWSIGDWRVSGGAYYEEEDRGIPGLIYSPLTPQANLTGRRRSTTISGQGDWQDISLEANVYGSIYSKQFTNPATQFNPETKTHSTHIAEYNRQTGERYGIRVGVVDRRSFGFIQWSYELRHDLYKGEDLLRDRVIIGGTGLGHARRTVHRSQAGVDWQGEYGDWTWHARPNLAGSWVVDHGLRSYGLFTPAASLTASRSFPLFRLRFDAGWSRSLTAPPFNSLFLVQSLFAIGNRRLKPEKGRSFHAAVSVDGNETPIFDYRLGLSLFHRTTEDLIVWRRNSFSKYFPSNLARTKNTGLELDVALFLLNRFISVSGNSIFNNPRIDTPGDINRGNIPPLQARRSGSLAVTARSGGLRTTVRARWSGRRFTTESNLDPISTAGMGLPPYAVYDLSARYSKIINTVDLSLEFGVDNLFAENYRIVERSPMPGRTLYGELSFKL